MEPELALFPKLMKPPEILGHLTVNINNFFEKKSVNRFNKTVVTKK